MLIRFFAGAAEAAGTEETRLLADDLTVTGLLSELPAHLPDHDPERLAKVLRVSSLLADGVRVDDPSLSLRGVAQLDVLPPFAGG
ncbi:MULTISPECIES: MoaD/ThiS family protein [Aestuariimicrobium]|uniref:MoaD/ThiS family protein n=1 Tax=Aestuariimicrobium TaxID=396388 RepID=UPI0003B361A1|nr:MULTISPECIES: MoaD/ThiS family protein [Aestuariimicrobium]CAI9402298.1 hypothetical protein AESSP_00771 [Aestuariimicrobium sp. T2.26MG-19.2B]